MATKSQLVTLVPVKNMKRAIGFYTKKLGGKVVFRGQGEMKDAWAALKVGGADLWFITGVREKRKLAYTTFVVKNIKKFVGELKKSGVKFDAPERTPSTTKVDGPIGWEPWGGSAFFKDTEGNLLMAWQNIPPM